MQRKKGFMDSIAEGKLQLLDSKTAHWETEEANTLMTNFLTQYHDIQGVMAANDSMALGVVKALDAAGLSGKIQVVGFDNIPAVQPLIKERQDARDRRAVRRRHGRARHPVRPEGTGGRELHRLGEDAGQADRGEERQRRPERRRRRTLGAGASSAPVLPRAAGAIGTRWTIRS